MKPRWILIALLFTLAIVAGCAHSPNFVVLDVPADSVAHTLKSAIQFREPQKLDFDSPTTVIIDESGPFLYHEELDTATVFRNLWFYGRAEQRCNLTIISFLETGSPHDVVIPLVRVTSETMDEVQVNVESAKLEQLESRREAIHMELSFELPWHSYYNIVISPDPRFPQLSLFTPTSFIQNQIEYSWGQLPWQPPRDVRLREIELNPSTDGMLELTLSKR